MKKVLVLAVALILVLSALAYAANNPQAKCAVHVQAHNAKMNCAKLPVIATCADINTTYPGYNYDAFPVFFDLVEYKAFEYGMCWPAEWVYSATWTGCEDLVIGGIQWSGDGITQTWFACQPGPVGVPGWAWMYADGPGTVCICNHPIAGWIVVLDCAEGLDSPMCNFCAGVYGQVGDGACEPTGAEPSTWGGIKAIFE